MPNQANAVTSGTSEGIEHYVSGKVKDGAEFRSPLVKLSPHRVVFETFHAPSEFRTSLVLTDFKIVVDEQTVYQGRAVINSLINLGTGTICEATLDDSWVDPTAQLSSFREIGGRAAFGHFLEQWQKYYMVRPEFKVVVADMQTFLTDMRLWLDQVELGIRASAAGKPTGVDEEVAAELGQHTTPALTSLFEKYESTLTGLEGDQPAAYRSFGKRQLHSLLLCSPFLHRTYTKPLGYAGDYEMVNMICGNPFQGGTLFAKVLNLWFLQQAPAEAHRNRIQFLVDRITEVALNAARAGRIAQITSLGCGPAQEVQQFIRESALSDHVHFRLVDFNEETVNYAAALLQTLKRRHHRRTQVEVVRKSVHQILKEAGRAAGKPSDISYDLVYCAGLYDYLTDQTCRRLTNILFESVLPGGMFISTNVDGSNPRRLTMDYLMDWHLIYRSAPQLVALRPDCVGKEEGTISSDYTGVNIYYTARKSNRG
jgi:extracellular factor (EF) 3-hydroxypalmitic acid methyl ester biosynthesis protein